MMLLVTALFESSDEVQRVVDELEDAEFECMEIERSKGTGKLDREDLIRRGVALEDARYYAAAVREGKALLVIACAAESHDDLFEILERFDVSQITVSHRRRRRTPQESEVIHEDRFPNETMRRQFQQADSERMVGEGRASSDRPTMSGVETAEHGSDTLVTVHLQLGDREFSGSADGPSNEPAINRSAAEATLRALENLVLTGYAESRIDWLDILEPPSPDLPRVAHVAVLFRTASREDLLVGSSIIRGVAYEAAVRATLDAVNRQVALLLQATQDDG